MRNLPWILLAFCIPLLGTGLYFSAQNHQLEEELVRLTQREQKIQKQLTELEPSDAQKNRESREKVDTLDKELLQSEALIRAGALFAFREKVRVREASVSRGDMTLAPKIRQLLDPIPAELPQDKKIQRETEKLLLEGLLLLGVEQIDHLEVQAEAEEASVNFPFSSIPIQIRYRVPKEETWKSLSAFLENFGSAPALYLQSMKWRVSAQDKKQCIVDLSFLGLLPTSTPN